jgi:hypothetical protein
MRPRWRGKRGGRVRGGAGERWGERSARAIGIVEEVNASWCLSILRVYMFLNVNILASILVIGSECHMGVHE